MRAELLLDSRMLANWRTKWEGALGELLPLCEFGNQLGPPIVFGTRIVGNLLDNCRVEVVPGADQSSLVMSAQRSFSVRRHGNCFLAGPRPIHQLAGGDLPWAI